MIVPYNIVFCKTSADVTTAVMNSVEVRCSVVCVMEMGVKGAKAQTVSTIKTTDMFLQANFLKFADVSPGFGLAGLKVNPGDTSWCITIL